MHKWRILDLFQTEVIFYYNSKPRYNKINLIGLLIIRFQWLIKIKYQAKYF